MHALPQIFVENIKINGHIGPLHSNTQQRRSASLGQ